MVQVGLQAYLMWEKAGKPDGANFSDDARRQLEQQLQSGKSVQDLERALKGPSDQAQQQGQQPAQVTDLPFNQHWPALSPRSYLYTARTLAELIAQQAIPPETAPPRSPLHVHSSHKSFVSVLCVSASSACVLLPMICVLNDATEDMSM